MSGFVVPVARDERGRLRVHERVRPAPLGEAARAPGRRRLVRRRPGADLRPDLRAARLRRHDRAGDAEEGRSRDRRASPSHRPRRGRRPPRPRRRRAARRRHRDPPLLCPAHADARGQAHARARSDRERLAALVRRLDYRLADYPAYRVDRLAACPSGHDAIVFAWDGPSPPDSRPPHVVASERELDPTFRRGAGWKKLLPYRRVFVSVCLVCGAQISEA